ncbi:MAG: asparagine synthase (glutamine-hydrolyzing) [Chitinispirillaceae bacterium]|nr:asparagine synthase (glutamine-hydrolyzing) [Chitinispirillaceae bacterium]
MCGITGVLGSGIDARRIVEHAAALQHHRGPDFSGSVATENYCVCHNRLSVIDLSPRSNQPFENDKGILVFNGEIYNFKSLSREHLSDDAPFSDAVVLFRLLQLKGASVLPLLDGMFAFSWYDKKKNTLLCARDRLGIKPFYYSLHDRMFFFASEIKTVLHLLENLTGYSRTDDINDGFIADIVAFGHAEFQRTPWRTIRELAPGTSLSIRVQDMRASHRTWFSIPETIAAGRDEFIGRASIDQCINRLDALLSESVRMHLISNAPIGILCSGGIDSSLITAIAARERADAGIFHAAVEGQTGELPYARMVAAKYGLRLHTITMNRSLFLDALVDSVYHLDVPMYHPSDISLYAISQKAHTQGIKALLCGEGADELFGGYGWHVVFNATVKRYSLLKRISRLINNGYRAFKLFRYADFFDSEEFYFYSGNYLTYTNRNIPVFAKRNALLGNAQSWQLLRGLHHAYENLDRSPHLAAFCTSNLFGHLSTLLQRNDRMCMRASIESRVPFLENGVIDFALKLDSSYKVRGRCGKYVVKKLAERYLPRSVIYRKKAGFPVPWQKYIRDIDRRIFQDGFMQEYFHRSFEDMLFWTTHDENLLFTAIALELWGRLFVRKEPREQIRELLR